MADGVGLSVGATNLTAVAVGRTAVTRSAVLTLFPGGRAPEVGVPSENPRLNSDERGLVITDFVDRVGDPVGIVAPDGTTHRGEVLLAAALHAMLYEVTNGRGATDPIAVTYPAHWRPATVDALRDALSETPELSGAALISDATAAVTALRDDPGVPTSGLIALCDFGGSGTSITLVEAANGNRPVGPTVRHTDLSGDLIDKAVLTHVLDGLSDAGAVDVTGTSAIGPLSRLRGQCRAAKERLSTSAATSLAAEMPGHRGDVRITRNELDDAIRAPLTEFAGLLQQTLDRNGAGPGDLIAVASAGGGARIPLITTTLSEHFGVPVVTTAQPELTSAIGGGLQAARGTVDESATAMAEAAPPTAAAAALDATQMAPEVGEFGAGAATGLAWSEADDIPDLAPTTDHYDYYAGSAQTDAMGGPRPQMQFTEPETDQYEAARRRPVGLLVAGAILVLALISAAVWFVLRNNESTPSPSSTTVTTTATSPAPTSAAPPPPETPSPEAPPPQETQTITRAPETITQTQAPPPPPTSEAPPPPPPTSEPPPPPPESPSSPPRLIPTLPYETIPGLPFVPNPIQPPAPAP